MDEKLYADRPHTSVQPQSMHENPMPREDPTPERTKELLTLAEMLSGIVKGQTQRHERCRLRRMVNFFLEEE